jgi:type II secretory pathway pseudopilin PulG
MINGNRKVFMADLDPNNRLDEAELAGRGPSYGFYLVAITLLVLAFIALLIGVGFVVIRDSRDRMELRLTVNAVYATNTAVEEIRRATATGKAVATTTPTSTVTVQPTPVPLPTDTVAPSPTSVPTNTPGTPAG